MSPIVKKIHRKNIEVTPKLIKEHNFTLKKKNVN